MLRFLFAKKRFQAAFVVSSPRSGSTWLSQALNAHPQIHCTENRFFGPHYDTAYDGPQKIARLRITLDAYVEALTKSISTSTFAMPVDELRSLFSRTLANSILTLERELSGKPILVDKFTPYLGTEETAIKNLSAAFPDAKFVHLIRDGRDVATSGVFHWLNKSTEEAESVQARERRLFYSNSSSESCLPRFFCDEELTRWATTWSETNTAMFSLGGSLPVHRISYEGMLHDQAGELRRLLEFLAAGSSKAVVNRCMEKSSFKVMSGGRNRGEANPLAHVRKGISGDWQTYFCRRDGEVFLGAASQMLQQLGYESSSEWVDRLPETLALQRCGSAGNRAA